MNRIDKFVYINLDKRKDRNEHILNELKRFEIPEEKIIRISAVESSKGAYGCAMSHVKAMELFKEHPDEVWCILEDDHYFTQNQEDTDFIVNMFLDDENYDVFLGCFCNLKGSDLPGGYLRRATQSSMTSFYIAKYNVCHALLASHKQSARSLNPEFGRSKGVPCDFMWEHLMKVFVFVAPYKAFGSQILNYSDIRNRIMNYTNYVGIEVDR